AFGLSRILLVTTANGASMVALVAALAVLTVAGVIASRGFHVPEKFAAGVAFVAIVAGGSVFAATIGIRPIEHHSPEPSFTFSAVNAISFEQSEATVEAAEELAIRFTNNDPNAPHNWGLQTDPTFNASPALNEPGPGITAGQSIDYVFEGLQPGSYSYFCFIHPNMTGVMTVTGEGEAPPSPSPSPAATGSPAASPTASPSPAASPTAPPADSVEITAKNIAFDTDALLLQAGEEISVTFHNEDAGTQHNFAIYSIDLSRKIFDTTIFSGVETKAGTFTAPDPGKYTFRCDVHLQMTGTVVFE
ncbi:MAG TPA: cupredoxin domain-containing protein, partial [Actinomycetota bacterium]